MPHCSASFFLFGWPSHYDIIQNAFSADRRKETNLLLIKTVQWINEKELGFWFLSRSVSMYVSTSKTEIKCWQCSLPTRIVPARRIWKSGSHIWILPTFKNNLHVDTSWVTSFMAALWSVSVKPPTTSLLPEHKLQVPHTSSRPTVPQAVVNCISQTGI